MEKGLIVYLLFAFGIIPLVLLATHWRKVVNPVIKVFHEISIFSRKKEYLPPRITIEGLGIKRDLNTIEVLLLDQKPFQVIFSVLLEKAMENGAIEVISIKPLNINADRILPETLEKIERNFVRICTIESKKRRQEKLANLMIGTIKSLSNQMRGHSLLETIGYYRSFIDGIMEKSPSEQTQNILGQLVEDMDEMTKTVTKATNPFKDAPLFKELPAYMTRRSYRGSGGLGGRVGGGGGCACAGCACACACAGCACACAGGGR
jgi:hypothetical protein